MIKIHTYFKKIIYVILIISITFLPGCSIDYELKNIFNKEGSEVIHFWDDDNESKENLYSPGLQYVLENTLQWKKDIVTVRKNKTHVAPMYMQNLSIEKNGKSFFKGLTISALAPTGFGGAVAAILLNMLKEVDVEEIAKVMYVSCATQWIDEATRYADLLEKELIKIESGELIISSDLDAKRIYDLYANMILCNMTGKEAIKPVEKYFHDKYGGKGLLIQTGILLETWTIGSVKDIIIGKIDCFSYELSEIKELLEMISDEKYTYELLNSTVTENKEIKTWMDSLEVFFYKTEQELELNWNQLFE